MNKLTITMVSLVGMTGLAFAQAKQADPKAAGSGAAAGAKQADPKAAPPVAAPTPPKPPAEIATTLKAMGTRANCTGTGLGPDMKTMVKFKGTTTSALALDGWWIKGSLQGTTGEGKTATKMKMDTYMTWDSNAKKWRTMGMINDGTAMFGTAEMKDGKMESVADTYGPLGQGMFKDHGDMTDPKAGMKMWGELSIDKGKTWIKVYEMTCKK